MSKVIADNFHGPNSTPANFPYGFTVSSSAAGTVNNIGTAGQAGFGCGICLGPLPAGMAELFGTKDPLSDNYGNYQYSDGSVMVWVPAFYYKWGTGSNGLAVNEVSIVPFSAYSSVATANAAGYALHRAFYDGGAVQYGVFVDKYICSYNNGIASSIKNGIVLTSAARGSLNNEEFANLTGAPSNTLGGAIAAAKTRGNNFFCNSRFIWSALALLSYAHAKASTSTAYCGWYDATYNHPKGCNNDAYGDNRDAAILYVADGNGTYNCPKTGSANLFSRTTHNGQNSGVCDMSGVVWEVTPGLTSDGTNLYLLNTSAQMKSITGGNTLATDLFGATGLAALYINIGTSYEVWRETGLDRTISYGAVTQVFSAATGGTAWGWAGAGGLLTTGDGGTNLFGSDTFYDYKPNECCPGSGGDWYSSSGAGVWALHLSLARAVSAANIGFRSALYL